MITLLKNEAKLLRRNRALQLYEVNRRDVTGTIFIRNRFAKEMRVKFNAIAKLIKKSVHKEDVFGLKERPSIFELETPGERAFEFRELDEKIEDFLEWLDNMVREEILEVINTPPRLIEGQPAKRWTDVWIHTAYQKGIVKARNELQKVGMVLPDFEGITRDGQYIGLEMNKRVHSDKIKGLYTRAYQDLNGITSDMESKIARLLSQGMADGLSPLDLAKSLRAAIGDDLGTTDKLGRFIPAKRRAEMLARTEIIRAHAESNLNEYEELGVEEVEFVFGGVNSCDECESLNGQTFKIEEARGVIPVHPYCGCGWSPVIDI